MVGCYALIAIAKPLLIHGNKINENSSKTESGGDVKRILVFLGLKVIEFGGVWLILWKIPLTVGRLVDPIWEKFRHGHKQDLLLAYLEGCLTIGILIMCLFVIYLFRLLVIGNWEKAGKITRR